MLKKFALAFAFLFAVSAAQAATISSVQKIAGETPVTGSGLLTSDGAGGFSFSGFGGRGAELWFAIDLSDVFASILVSGPAPFPLTLFATAPVDVASGPGVLTALYQPNTNNVDPDFNLFLAEFFFSPTEGDPLTQIVGAQGALTISAVEKINVIPLPATLPMLLAGFGGLALLRRRRKAA